MCIRDRNKDFGLNISKENVEINFFGDVIIHGLDIKDFKGKEMIKAKELKADSDWFSLIFNSRNLKFNTLTLKEADVKVVTLSLIHI